MRLSENQLVTIICPSYGHKRFIGDAIDSFVSQTHTNLEILVIDDCSPDDSNKIIKKKNDSRIRLIENKYNRGTSNSLNIGISEAKGLIICICSSDDMMKSEHISSVIDAFDKDKSIGAVYPRLEYINENNETTGYSEYAIGERYYLLRQMFFEGNNSLHAPGSAYRKETLENVGRFNPGLIQTQDFDFNVRTLINNNVAILPESTVRYRRRDNGSNLSGGAPWVPFCYNNEHEYVLDNFLSIATIEIFKYVFRDCEIRCKPDAIEEIPFCVAMVAAVSPYDRLVDWGLRTIARILGDGENWDYYNTKFGFDYKTFLMIYNEKYSGRKELVTFKNVIKKYMRRIITKFK